MKSTSQVMTFCRARGILNKNYKEWIMDQTKSIINSSCSVLCKSRVPYHIQICLNGREWLRRELEREGISFFVHGNKFLHIADYQKAQRLLDKQFDIRFTNLLNGFALKIFPNMNSLLRHAHVTGTSRSVLRYLDRPVTKSGQPYTRSPDTVMTRITGFNDGIRLRHWVDQNSVFTTSKIISGWKQPLMIQENSNYPLISKGKMKPRLNSAFPCLRV